MGKRETRESGRDNGAEKMGERQSGREGRWRDGEGTTLEEFRGKDLE